MIRLIDQIADFGSKLTGIEAKKFRFLAVGGFNLVFGLAIYPILIWTLPASPRRYLVALLLAQVISTAVAFITHKLIVFQTRGNLLSEFWRFASFYLTGYAINWLILPPLVEIAQIQPIIAQTGYTLIFVVLSYYWHNNITFNNHREKNNPDGN